MIFKLILPLKTLPEVHAMWLEGSYARGKADRFSDIDLWLDVADGAEAAVLDKVRELFRKQAELDLDYEIDHPDPKIRQIFLHLKDTDPCWVIDLCIQSHSRVISFDPVVDSVEVLFDKTGVIRFEDRSFDLAARARTLLTEVDVFGHRMTKALARGDFLEAVSAYQNYILEPLVERLRLRYSPANHDFGLKHIRQDLPMEVVLRLEAFYKVKSLEDLENKYHQAKEWLTQLEET